MGTPGRVLVLDVLSPGEGSNFSTVLVILPDLLLHDPDDLLLLIMQSLILVLILFASQVDSLFYFL